ncbi:MAG TPA: siphovirus ReqiPepy6 Gp37-like family protein [Ruminococcus sp.]|nr:siphovirus ReqiPepy6 Gp37-like family protein [Ruminococcus sp.]
MQIEVYKMIADGDSLTITLEAICDSFSSLLWDIEYYQCGSFEVYIAASPLTIEVFQTGRIVGRDDDDRHFGIIESVLINTDIENGDYLTVRGRFLMCLLERRIIHPTYNVTAQKAYSEIVREVVTQNALLSDNRRIPGLSLGTVSGSCWEQTATMQVSYENLMEWVYTICEKIGGTANIRLVKDVIETYKMVIDLSEGTDRSLMQEENPHIVFSDAYSNLLSFSYAEYVAIQRNFAYIYGHSEGAERKNTTYCVDAEPTYLDR